MAVESLFALIFLGCAFLAALIGGAMDAGLFDQIAIKLTDYIVSRMERNEREDI